MSNGKIKIWVDDVREATSPEYIVCLSVNQCIGLIEKVGIHDIELLDLDHDAGDFAIDGGDYIKILDYLELKHFKDVNIHLHSKNPVGIKNMQRIIQKNEWNLV